MGELLFQVGTLGTWFRWVWWFGSRPYVGPEWITKCFGVEFSAGVDVGGFWDKYVVGAASISVSGRRGPFACSIRVADGDVPHATGLHSVMFAAQTSQI